MYDIKKQIEIQSTLVKKLQNENGRDHIETKIAIEKMKELREIMINNKPDIKKTHTSYGEVAYMEERMALVNKLGEKREAYPHKFKCSYTIKELITKYEKNLNDNEINYEESITIAGRINSVRTGKTSFYDLIGDGEKIQLVLTNLKNIYEGTENEYKDATKIYHRGDIVGIKGYPGKTMKGEMSVYIQNITLLTPCLKMLPKDHYGFKDQEQRYRQRYLDLIVNKEKRKTFEIRADIIRYIRNYLDNRGFLEVETPMMSSQAGGATARPFITHHNDLHVDMYMRVAPELFLKECIIGGLERVYEIGRNFRNEGIDLTHNPEFTSCEFYWAYADYNDLIKETEEIISGIVLKIHGKYEVEFHIENEHTGKKESHIINFKPPYRRVHMIPALEEKIGEKFPPILGSNEGTVFLTRMINKYKLDLQHPHTNARMLDKLVDNFLEREDMNPTFIMDHPKIMSPLAKWHRGNDDLTERFELFIMGKEICNAYTELNSPITQRERFTEQMKDSDAGDLEAQPIDEKFITALEYGLPPTAGWGIGIDRLTMMLTSQMNIKEVILFPAMKPIGK